MSPPLLEAGRLTMPAFLKHHGFHTACIGKWHLGFDWSRKPDTPPFTDGVEKGEDGWRVDFSKPIAGGPNTFGFEFFFGIAASLDMVPYSFIENDRLAKVPTVDKAFPMMSGRSGGTTRKGPAAEDFEAIDVLPTLTRRAVGYLDSVSILPALEGRATAPIREALVHHSINGSFAIRQERWKLALCADSGGWSTPQSPTPQPARSSRLRSSTIWRPTPPRRTTSPTPTRTLSSA